MVASSTHYCVLVLFISCMQENCARPNDSASSESPPIGWTVARLTIAPVGGHLASSPPFATVHSLSRSARHTGKGEPVRCGSMGRNFWSQGQASILLLELAKLPFVGALPVSTCSSHGGEGACFSTDGPGDYAIQFLDLCQTGSCKSSISGLLYWYCSCE